MPSLYEQLRDAGCALDNHESDLYVKATPEAVRLVTASKRFCSYFTHQGTGELWLDVAFAYDPWWKAREVIEDT